MAEAVVNFAVETIGNLLIEEAKFLHGVSDQVEPLQRELSLMRSFLKDADARQHDEEMVKEWISQARHLAYAAEDLLEAYAFKVATRSREGTVRSTLKKCFCILNKCYASHTIGVEIQSLKAEISNLTRSFQEYGIRALMERSEGDGSTSSLEQELRRTYSHSIEDDFVGLEGDVELLVKQLVRENVETDHHFRVVSICGMGGLGKTTLARKVYNFPSVKRCFDGFAWVCVSQNWKKEDILQRILLSLIPERRKEILKWRDEELVRQLFQIQQNNKYLVVLDDIWSTAAWECIKQAFPIRKDGTKILLTTRNKDVALQIDPNGFHHQPRLLSNEESWELLWMKALRDRFDGDHEDMQKLEELGKEMVKACGGLPLAVIVLGGTLARKKRLDDWETVYKNIQAHLGRGNNLMEEKQGYVRQILALSYNDLPYKLKPCFLYLSKFEEDSDIDAETLYQLWIAEGMISVKDQIGEESMMDVAERYLGELIQRCMVQGKAPEISSISGSFKSCRLHDLMRDLSVLKAKEENFLSSISYSEGFDDHETITNSSYSSLTDHVQVYRLVIRLAGECVTRYVPPEKRITRHLRSLALLALGNDGNGGPMPRKMKSQFNQFKMLRVLLIERFTPKNFDTCKDIFFGFVDHLKLPKAVGKLIHLRYLSLRGSIFLCLPSSLGKLQHLQTLDLRDSIVLRVPNVLWKMRQLRHLYLPSIYSDFMADVLGTFNFSCKLRLKGLSKLEILEGICMPPCRAEDLANLNNLRALSASVFMDFADPTEIIEFVSSSQHLRRTSLYIVSNKDSTTAMEKLSAVVGRCFSCCNLQLLSVDGPMANLPKYEAQSFCARLIGLNLTSSLLKEDPMETLENIPTLRSLSLGNDSFSGEEMRCRATGFGQLKILSLFGLLNLEKWRIDEGGMPNLSNLSIHYCPKLEMVPNGLRFITMLKELEIVFMAKEFTDRLQVVDGRQGEDFDKVAHVPSIIIRGPLLV